MSASPPGVLIARDGTIRRYLGHSNQKGTVLGSAERLPGRWRTTCAGCGITWCDERRLDGAYKLRDHWDYADSSMAATHQETER